MIVSWSIKNHYYLCPIKNQYSYLTRTVLHCMRPTKYITKYGQRKLKFCHSSSSNDCNPKPGTWSYNCCVWLHWHLSFHKFDLKYFKNKERRLNSFDMYSLFRVCNHCFTNLKPMLKYVSQNFDINMCRGFQIWQLRVM